MSEIQFYELKCKRCGGQLEQNGLIYKCQSCGKMFEKQVVTDVADQLRAVLNEQKQEAVANLRQQLWAEMHEQYINSEKITELARDIKKYLPEDYFANFCEVANSGNDRQISQFLNNTHQSAMADYADIVLDFMLKSVTASNLNAISLFIERAFKGDTVNYDKYITRYEEEAQKVNSGIYELIITRDVFLAYSSKDMNKVLELCDYLERNKISCFLALRNLRHGRGAVDNYDEALKTAIDNCKTVVFVSSTNSRDMTCDALIKELPYIKKKDFENAPAECKRNYYKIPSEYLMPRVQYLIEDYKNEGNVAEGIVDEFFHDLEWCRSKEEVARRVSEYLTETHETAAQRAERESRKFQQQLEEERRKARELELRIAEAEKARLEAERKIKEEQEARQYDQQSKLEEERRKAKELELRIAEAEKARLEAERKRQEEQEARQYEQQSKLEEERRKAKELELRIAEAEKARLEAERKAAEQRQNTSTESIVKEDPNAKYCKKCRTANRKTAKFCSSCGSSEFFANFDEYLASKIKFCAACGAQNNAEDKFCVECGSKEFVPTKKAYEELVVKRAEEERKRREAEEEAERQQKLRKNFVIYGKTAVRYNGTDKDVEIPNNVIRLGKELFCNRASIKSIIIPNSVQVIEDSVFKGCVSLTKLVIPESVCDIGAWVFDNCPNLNLIFEDTSFGNVYLEEERQRKLREEEKERQRKEEAERYRKELAEQVRKRNEEAERLRKVREKEEQERKLREEQERKRKEEERKLREEQERKRKEEERKRKEEEERQRIESQRKLRELQESFRIAEEERKRKLQEEERQRKEEAERYRKELEEQARKRNEEAERLRKNREKEEQERKIREEEERLRREKEERQRYQRYINVNFVIQNGLLVKYKGKGGDVKILKEITSISLDAFGGDALVSNFEVSSDNKTYKSIDGDLYSYDGKTLKFYAAGKTQTAFAVPKGVVFIGKNSFNNSRSLENIVIPDSVTAIGSGAFNNCNALKSIIIPNGVTFIGNDIFDGCGNLQTIYCRVKKPLIGLPKGWNKEWLGNCHAQVVWNYKGK